jgi:hypothetical protein
MRVAARDLISTALISHDNFRAWREPLNAILAKTIGTLEAGLWPPKIPIPALVIHDAELRQRCADLLSAPGKYDRVIREATTVLEDRIKQKVPPDVLVQKIPNIKDRTLGKMSDEFFSPTSPVLSISADRTSRVALFKMLQGVDSYLRNPYHHQLDETTEWSWAWSAVGLVDRLLRDVENSTLKTD